MIKKSVNINKIKVLKTDKGYLHKDILEKIYVDKNSV